MQSEHRLTAAGTGALRRIRSLSSAIQGLSKTPSRDEIHSLRKLAHEVLNLLKMIEVNSYDFAASGKLLERIRKSAGAVRDVDVLVSLVSRFPVDQADESLFEILESLASKRVRQVRKLRAVVGRYGDHVRRDLMILFDWIEENGATHARGRAMWSGGERVSSLLTQLAMWPGVRKERLHDLRQLVRDLRSVLRILEWDPHGIVPMLGEVKDAIGSWHDWTVLNSFLAEGGGRGSPQVMEECRRTVRSMYVSARLKAMKLQDVLQKLKS